MLFASIAIPILEEAAGLLLAWMETLKGKATLKITKINKEIQDIAYKQEEEPKKRPIGFCVTQEEDEVEEEED